LLFRIKMRNANRVIFYKGRGIVLFNFAVEEIF